MTSSSDQTKRTAFSSPEFDSEEELLRASAFFDAHHYLNLNPDLKTGTHDPVDHYLEHGAREGRDPGPNFSTLGYLERYPDVQIDQINPLVHFLRYGLYEGRDPGQVGSMQQPMLPMESKPELEPAPEPNASARLADEDDLRLLRSSEFFDPQYYLARNPDVAKSGHDAALHYLNSGAAEGRDPSELFSTTGYLKRHEDVASNNLNPLVHYLRHGKFEGRAIIRGKSLVPALTSLYDERWLSLKPLAVFHVPESAPRVTVITDSVGPSSLFGGVGTAIILGTLLANRLGASLRLVTRTDEPDARALNSILRSNDIVLDGLFEIAFAPLNDSQLLPVSAEDIFITTSWWTTRATLGAIPRRQLIYLLQEDERMFYPYGDERLLCSETLGEHEIPVIINTYLLHEHLSDSQTGYPEFRHRAIAFEPAFPAAGAISPGKRHGAKRKFFFYSRPHNQRNLFWRGATALANAIEDGIFDPEQWDFFLVGKDTPTLMLPRGVKPSIVEGMDWNQYQTFVASLDAGLVLMDTPHPSYPPLDLAGAGVAVLTNTHGNKTDLSHYSRNILMTPPSLEGLLQGLSRVVALGLDDAQRHANRASDGIGRDWNLALEPVVQHLAHQFSVRG